MSSSRCGALSSERMPSLAGRTAMGRLAFSRSRGSPASVPRRGCASTAGRPLRAVCGAQPQGTRSTMRIVVTGATGNVGTSVVAALADDARVTEIVGVARRLPQWVPARTRWVQADVSTSPLTELFRGADAVIHLAWLIQPSRDEATLAATNVIGSRRVFEAAAEAGARALVYASSVGAYSPGPDDRAVD